MADKVEKKDQGLHPWTILIFILFAAIIAGYLIPSGMYDRITTPDGVVR
ncbi:hypothetical protein [Dolosicoccus paucivorans]|nr:hypothetical protein [Dolosicoccus paucivorans]